jgi:predicted dehydrogenase
MRALDDPASDIVVVATPNAYLVPIALAALDRGKHVLIEKPPGRNLEEARQLAQASARTERCVVKIGFNHRYHPAIMRAQELYQNGVIGPIINIRGRYGHGGRLGYEHEWRSNPRLAGGGELTDQGIHLVDLLNWLAGMPQSAYCLMQTAVWPIAPIEDNAFALLKYPNGVIASFHSSWTQWSNLFSLEIFGENGSLSVEGLTGNYGDPRLQIVIRKSAGGAPDVHEERFDSADESWAAEWCEFISAIVDGRHYSGTPAEGLAAMTVADALYRSVKSGCPVSITA